MRSRVAILALVAFAMMVVVPSAALAQSDADVKALTEKVNALEQRLATMERNLTTQLTKISQQLASGAGSIYSFSVVRQSYHPFFRTQAPYAVAWIDLDEGVRLLSNVIGVEDPGSQLSIGQRVTVTWEEHDELCIPLFRPL